MQLAENVETVKVKVQFSKNQKMASQSFVVANANGPAVHDFLKACIENNMEVAALLHDLKQPKGQAKAAAAPVATDRISMSTTAGD